MSQSWEMEVVQKKNKQNNPQCDITLNIFKINIEC